MLDTSMHSLPHGDLDLSLQKKRFATWSAAIAASPQRQAWWDQVSDDDRWLLQWVNAAVNQMAAESVYCEIGAGQTGTTIAALLNHPDCMAYTIAEPQQRLFEPQLLEQWAERLSQLQLEAQVCFSEQLVEEFFADLGELGVSDRIGVYVYQGAVDYRSLLVGLMSAVPFLADQAVILLRVNSPTAQQAILDFLTAYPQASELPADASVPQSVVLLQWNATAPQTVSEIDWQQGRQPEVIRAIRHVPDSFRVDLQPLQQRAVQLHVQGRLAEAEAAYKLILSYDSQRAEVWQQLGMVYYLNNQPDRARIALEQALHLDQKNVVSYHILGLVLEQQAESEAAIAAYRIAINLDPNYIDALNNLGDLLVKQGDAAEAEQLYRTSIAIRPNQILAYVHWGDLLLELQQPEAAIQAYHQALDQQKENSELWQKLSQAYTEIGDAKQSSLSLVHALHYQGKPEAAITEFQKRLNLEDLKTMRDCSVMVNCFHQCDYIPETIACFAAMAQLMPDDRFAAQLPQLVLPMIYQSVTEIETYRQRYIDAFEQLWHQQQQAQATGEPLRMSGIQNFTLFHLAYQGRNDRAIQAIYGNLLQHVIAETHPGCSRTAVPIPTRSNGKIRIGYVSISLVNNSANRWAVGWLENHDRQKFELYCYSIETDSDIKTQHFKLLSDTFRYLPSQLEAAHQQLLDDQLDVLVFLAIGTHPKVAALASLRSAPIQCSAWGHPVTSGIPTIDYFLSSELMEPENAQEHYTEQLVRLPNIGICYPKPRFHEGIKSRSDFGLREDAVVYLSCQLIFKYLPQHDYLIPEIIRQVPQAQLVFVVRATMKHSSVSRLEQQFRQRLEQAFQAVNLTLTDHCLFLEGQSPNDYASLLHCTDVFLDTPTFSGGHTTFDAIAYGVPVVTHAGELIRGRQSYGILKRLGIPETIAHTEAEYIEIAARLGNDADWRREIKQRILDHQDDLFDDVTCVRGLEQFYERAIQARRANLPLDSVQSDASTSKSVLHVGCGPYHPDALPSFLRPPEWREVRLDINPEVQPDIIGTITDLSAVPDRVCDAVFCSHNLEHVYAHEVPIALSEFYRVLKVDGFVLIAVPDIQQVAEAIAQGNLESPLYESAAGPISAIDIVYGLRTAIAQGNHFMAHRTAFTADTLKQKLEQAGFRNVRVHVDYLSLLAKAYR